jgi:hypothetical protein
LPDLSANLDLLEKTAEDVYPLPPFELEQLPTSTTIEGVEAP